MSNPILKALAFNKNIITFIRRPFQIHIKFYVKVVRGEYGKIVIIPETIMTNFLIPHCSNAIHNFNVITTIFPFIM